MEVRASQTRIELFGQLRVQQDGRFITRFRTQMTASLLAYLAYHRERTHGREELIQLIWPEIDPQAGRSRLSTALSALRQQLEPAGVPPGSILIADRFTVGLNPATVTTDVAQFRDCLERAARATSPVAREEALVRAVDLYRSPLLRGCYDDWVLAEQLHLADRFSQAVLQLTAHLEQFGQLNRALEYARRAVSADPFREEAHREVMRLCAAAGEPAAALRQFRQLQRLFEDQGAAPSELTRALARRIECGELGPRVVTVGGERWGGGAIIARCGGDSPGARAVERLNGGGRERPGAPPGLQLAPAPPLPRAAAPPADVRAAPAPARNGHAEETAGGAVPLASAYYLERESDRPFCEAIVRGDSLVLVKGPRDTGKTSLLARGLLAARDAGAPVVLTDFGKITPTQLASEEALFFAIAESLAYQLQLEPGPETYWNPRRGWNVNFERFMERGALASLAAGASPPPASPLNAHPSPHLVWGLDNVDRIVAVDFGTDLFSLFRAWHNERALDPACPWQRLTLVITHATEPHLLVTDADHSPFNVGTRFELGDFRPEETAELNCRHGSPLRDAMELARFQALLGGHPCLVRSGLRELAAGTLDLPALERQAEADGGPFRDHLRRLLSLLTREPALLETLRQVLAGGGGPAGDPFYHLRSLGVLAGDGPESARLRCELYRRTFQRHLG